MHYSYEYKLDCVELFKQGKWPTTPAGLNEYGFHDMVREWSKKVDVHGEEILQHRNISKKWSVEEKYDLVAQVNAGKSMRSLAVEKGISYGMLYRWVNKFQSEGYNGLVPKTQGRPKKEIFMKERQIPSPLNESEREELIRLRAENEYIKAENEVIKKEIALREQKDAAQLKAKKQQSSKNLEKKAIH